MDRKPIPRRYVVGLIAGLLLLPLAAWSVVAVSSILGAMGDSDGAIMLHRIAWICGALWAVNLVCLVVTVGLNSLSGSEKDQ